MHASCGGAGSNCDVAVEGYQVSDPIRECGISGDVSSDSALSGDASKHGSADEGSEEPAVAELHRVVDALGSRGGGLRGEDLDLMRRLGRAEASAAMADGAGHHSVVGVWLCICAQFPGRDSSQTVGGARLSIWTLVCVLC